MLTSCSSLFSTDFSLHGFIFSDHKKIEEFALVGIQLLRELPSVTIDETLSVTLPPPHCHWSHHHCHWWDPAAAPGPLLTPHTPPTARPGFLTGSSPGFPRQSQISPSIKPFIPSPVTQTQPEPVPLRGIPTKAFVPGLSALHSPSTEKPWLFFLSPGLLRWLWVSLTQLCHRPSDPLSCKASQVTSSCLSGLQLNLQLANQATCTRCVPQHKHNATWLLGFKQEAKAPCIGRAVQEPENKGNAKV